MSEPKRIQRKRTRGWRMPKNAVYVGRPSGWGNPYKVMKEKRGFAVYWSNEGEQFKVTPKGKYYKSKSDAAGAAIRLYRLVFMLCDFSELRGKDLACWCPLDQPCHADVLLELANEDTAPIDPPPQT